MAVSAPALKQFLIDNPEKIRTVLQSVGFTDIDDKFKRGEEFRCSWEEGTNPTSVRVNKSTLNGGVFSHNIKGDLFVIVAEKLNMDIGSEFPNILNKIASMVSFDSSGEYKPKEDIFGGFFKRVKKIQERNNDIELDIYDEDILLDYEYYPSLRFVKDNINPWVQQKYNIGYDRDSNRITVPWRDTGGNIIGIMGRLNKDNKDISPNEPKWFPVIPFPKSQAVFGYSENYTELLNHKILMIGESEKFNMQLESKNIKGGLGIGGSELSVQQANIIKSLYPDVMIICMDEGLEIEYSVEIAKKLKSNIFNSKVYYINDKNNIWLPKGSKMSVSDLPREDIKSVIKQCAKKV